MLTKSRFQEACEPLSEVGESQEFKKGNVILMNGVRFIVMARLQADSENPITYSICRLDDYLGVQFGVNLAVATLIATESLTPEEQQRANSFT